MSGGQGNKSAVGQKRKQMSSPVVESDREAHVQAPQSKPVPITTPLNSATTEQTTNVPQSTPIPSFWEALDGGHSSLITNIDWYERHVIDAPPANRCCLFDWAGLGATFAPVAARLFAIILRVFNKKNCRSLDTGNRFAEQTNFLNTPRHVCKYGEPPTGPTSLCYHTLLRMACETPQTEWIDTLYASPLWATYKAIADDGVCTPPLQDYIWGKKSFVVHDETAMKLVEVSSRTILCQWTLANAMQKNLLKTVTAIVSRPDFDMDTVAINNIGEELNRRRAVDTTFEPFKRSQISMDYVLQQLGPDLRATMCRILHDRCVFPRIHAVLDHKLNGFVFPAPLTFIICFYFCS